MTSLQQFGDDIWITDEIVDLHTDKTENDNLTYGYILINTGYVLIYDEKEIDIPVGSIYRIDARKKHGTKGNGILAVLIWDMPNWTLEDFKKELKNDPRFRNFK